MRNSKYLSIALALFTGLLLVLAASACVQSIPETPSEITITPTPTPVEGERLPPTPIEEEKLPPIPRPEHAFVPNQFVVIGPDLLTIEAVIAGAMEGVQELHPELKLSSPPQIGEEPVELKLLGQTMVVYEFVEPPSELPVENLVKDVVLQILKIAGNPGEYGFADFEPNFVLPDLNYFTTLSQTPTPTPATVLASPWEVEGSPGGGSKAGKNAPAGDFATQWAFNQIDYSTRITYTGEGVRIGIFDTSPCSAGTAVDCGGLAIAKIDNFPVPPTPTPPAGGVVIDHGVFVGGLLHHIAPDSEIYLLRVLNDYGLGTSASLIAAVDSFVTAPDDLKPVINLSLGVLPPESDAVTDSLLAPYDLPVPQLAMILNAATQQGAVIVGAAGNHSFGNSSPKPSQIPASYPFVISVAASTSNRNLACFSNSGDIAAPGGGDGPTPNCLPNNNFCKAQPQFCLISLSPDSSPKPSGTGYAFWSGTSFSTPLVSGLSALLLEKGESPANVESEIIAGGCPSPDPNLPNGVVNVSNTLMATGCPTPTPPP